MTATNSTASHSPAADLAAQRLYQAEIALHDAHSTHVDAWIAAAADRLHDAIVAYLAAVAANRGAVRS